MTDWLDTPNRLVINLDNVLAFTIAPAIGAMDNTDMELTAIMASGVYLTVGEFVSEESARTWLATKIVVTR